MSGYQPGRRAPNLSHYIAGLNQIPQEDYTDFTQDDYSTFEDDLALFTNTEFIHNDIIDFDLDFDFTQSIPGEEEYYSYNDNDHIHQQQQEVDTTEKEDNSISGSSKTAASTVASSILPPPPPHPPISGTTSSTSTLATSSSTSSSNKKQKLSPRSEKPVTATPVISDVTDNSSSITSSSPSSSPSSSSTSAINPHSATNSANSVSIGTKTTTGIPISSIDNNTSSTNPAAAATISTFDQPQPNNHQEQQQPPTAQVGNGDMNFDGDFHFTDIGFTPQGNITTHNIPYGASTSGYDYNIPPQSPFDPKHQLNTPVTTPPNGVAGVRPQGILPDAAALLEASSRAAAEEDKRRRNTAASARFRFKKKQREQALEKSAKDMTDKLDKLEEKINQLEKENAWLRSLVVERTAKTSEEMAELYKTFKEEERSKESHKKGVGTLSADN